RKNDRLPAGLTADRDEALRWAEQAPAGVRITAMWMEKPTITITVLPRASHFPKRARIVAGGRLTGHDKARRLLACACVPDLQCPVGGGADQALAVRVECHPLDTRWVPAEGQGFLAGLHIIKLQRLVLGAACQAFAIWTESHAGDAGGMSLTGEKK